MKNINNFSIFFTPLAQALSYYLLLGGANGIVLPLLFWMLAGLFNPLSVYSFYSLLGILSPLFLFLNNKNKKSIRHTNIIRTIATMIIIFIVGISLYENLKVYDGGYTFTEILPFISFFIFILINGMVLFKSIKLFIFNIKNEF